LSLQNYTALYLLFVQNGLMIIYMQVRLALSCTASVQFMPPLVRMRHTVLHHVLKFPTLA